MRCPRCGYDSKNRIVCDNCKRSLLPDVPQDDGIIIEPWDKDPHTNGCLIRTSFILICIFVFIILLKYL